MPNLAAYFIHAGWPAEEIEPDVWRSTFADETGATYTLYALATAEWIHLAVSPLLRANQELRLARLALDDDGDINLLADCWRRM